MAASLKRMSVRTPLIVALCSFVSVFPILFTRWLFIHEEEPADFNLKVINFVVAWLPFVATLFIAVFPTHMTSKRIGARISIAAVGFCYSVLLWHQQSLTMKASRRDQESAVTKAIVGANQHSDEQIRGVKNDLQATKTDLGTRIDKLPGLISKSEAELNGSISRVGITPPKYAQLQFSFFDPFPSTERRVPFAITGIYSADLTITNISDTAAKSVEIWVSVCDECEFISEPVGFDKPEGTVNLTRHKMFAQLNPGVSLAKWTIQVKVQPRYNVVLLLMRYSCETCGKASEPQILRIIANSF